MDFGFMMTFLLYVINVSQYLGSFEAAQLVLVVQTPDEHFGPDGGGGLQP